MAKTPELQRFYANTPWQRIRRRMIIESGGVCASCGQIVTDTSDLIVHHKIELTPENYKDVSISLNPDNLEVLCWACHSKHHAAERDPLKLRKQVFVVWGAPCSGKSTYVREQAGPDDLIVDLDLIYSSLSLSPLHVHPKSVQAIAFGVRNFLLDQVRTRTGKWSTAWVIGAYPLAGERQALLSRLRADDIYIPATKEECLERLQQRDPECRQEIARAIEEFFSRVQGVPADGEGVGDEFGSRGYR